jgi:hypothetical protein
MKKVYVMVRVAESTHGALVEIRDRLAAAILRGHYDDVSGRLDDGISLGEVIDRLVRHWRRDKRRVAEAKARKRTRRRAAGQPQE